MSVQRSPFPLRKTILNLNKGSKFVVFLRIRLSLKVQENFITFNPLVPVLYPVVYWEGETTPNQSENVLGVS